MFAPPPLNLSTTRHPQPLRPAPSPFMSLGSAWPVLKFYFLIKICLGSNSGQVILLEGSFSCSSIICLGFKEGGWIYLLINSTCICGSWLLINRRGCGHHQWIAISACVPAPVPFLSLKDLGGKLQAFSFRLSMLHHWFYICFLFAFSSNLLSFSSNLFSFSLNLLFSSDFQIWFCFCFVGLKHCLFCQLFLLFHFNFDLITFL